MSTGLDLYIDFKSVAAYLAIKPTLALAAETGATIRWLPFLSRVRSVDLTPAGEETKGEKHIRVREIMRRQLYQRYAGHQGIELEFPEHFGATDLALAALAWYADENPLPFVQAAFHHYWHVEADLNKPESVSSLLNQVGWSERAFDPDQAMAKLGDLQTAALERGVIDTPAYIVSDQLFIGREHLPWIRSLLTSG